MRINRLSLPLFVLLCTLVTFIACTKYKDTAYSDELPADKQVTTTIQGRVVDESGLPVAGAVVSGGGKDTTTDVNGNFTFNNIEVSSRFGYVKVVKSGYFPGGRSVITNADGTNYMAVQLIPRASKGSFTASTGGTIVVAAGDTVVFDPASIVTASTGTAYTGTVHVYAAYLDPTDSKLSQIMPGDLRGIGTDGKETALQTFGMVVVEMDGDAGEKLQLASGKPAAITLRIPDALKTTAPETIPLWYFNDTTGKWIEQGTATKKDGSYCGTTSHFSFWNCDRGTGVVNFKLHLQDPGGNPMVYTHLQFVAENWGTADGYTDAQGNASGLIPKGQSLVLQVLNPCGAVAFGENLGPVLSDQNLGTVTVSLDTAVLKLAGTVVDCSSNPVVSGYVNVLVDGFNYRTAVSNGAFTIAITRCSKSRTTAALQAGDLIAGQVGDPVSVSVIKDSVNVGTLTACGLNFNQVMNVTVNGTTYTWTDPPDNLSYSVAYGIGYIGGNHTYAGDYLYSYLYTPIAGTGLTNISSLMLSTSTIFYRTQNKGDIKLNVTEYGAVGGYIQGTLSGQVIDSLTNNPYQVTGNLKLIRTQ